MRWMRLKVTHLNVFRASLNLAIKSLAITKIALASENNPLSVHLFSKKKGVELERPDHRTSVIV
jgi:hypothetical protein